MKLKHLFIYALATTALFSACSSDNDTTSTNNEPTLRISSDNIKYTINTSHFGLKGDVKSVEKSYFWDAEYESPWRGNPDSIIKHDSETKEIISFDDQGAITKDQKIFLEYGGKEVRNYDLLEKNWVYDPYYRIIQYSEQSSTNDNDESATFQVSSNKLEYIFDDAAKQATMNTYTGDSDGKFSLIKMAQYVLSNDKRIIYPQNLTQPDKITRVMTRSSEDQNIYDYYYSQIDLGKSKKQTITYTDSKGNIVKSYVKYDIRDVNNIKLTSNLNLNNYYEQVITYYDGTSSANSVTKETITDNAFEVVVH